MHTKHKKDHLTHPEYDLKLWLEVGAIDGPNKNWVYSISTTTTRNIRSNFSVSTIDNPQSSTSHPSQAIEQLVEQRTDWN